MIEKGRVRGFLRGESWRMFHWKKFVVGRKLYRIQYADEPPAGIDFSDLVHFLLDWGAVPDESGWGKLKSGGLRTPGRDDVLSTRKRAPVSFAHEFMGNLSLLPGLTSFPSNG
jgi:hypothetical protein